MSDTEDRTPLVEPLVDQDEKTGSIIPLLVLAGAFLAATVLFASMDRTDAEPYVLFFLALLALVGVVSLFAFSVGFLRLASRAPRDPLARPFLDLMPEGVVVVTDDGRVLYANRAYGLLTGATGARDIKSAERVFASEPEAAEVVYRLAQAARARRVAHDEVRLSRSANGTGPGARWYRLRVRPILNDSGKAVESTIWEVSDITREREKHENIFQELQHAVDFLDHAPAGFLSAEPGGRITYLNATLADWLGYDLAEVDAEGMTLDQIVAGAGAALLSGQNHTPGQISTEIVDIDLVKCNGQNLPVRLFHRVPYAADGTAGASRTLVLNRSPGADVAEELRASEVRFARFFNNTPIAIAAIDREGRIVRANAPFARMFSARNLSDAEGPRDLVSLVDEPSKASLVTALKLAGEGRSDITPVDVALDGGHDRSAQVFVSPVVDGEADGEAVIVYALETTEQKALEQQFTQSQKMQAFGQLAGGVAHDFNNMLQAIIGNADLLMLNHKPTDPSFKFINQIKQNGNRAAALVRHLLAFSRKQTLRPRQLGMGDVISDLSMTLDRVLGEKVKLEVVHGRDLWPVLADLNQFEQVIINLAVNARDAMPEGGTLTISTHNLTEDEAAKLNYKGLVPGDYVVCDVSDTGTGIPPDIMDKIFEPFFTTKDIGKGTGLGLSTVYGIIKQTGGYIYPESSIGQGTTFRILLPRHIPDVQPIEEQAAVEEQHAEADLTGAATILLVEDEESVRMVAAQVLSSRGYTVHEAQSGTEALSVMEEVGKDVDLVVSDVVMPEMDGPSLLRELRKTRPDLKVIFVSGYAEDAFAKNLPENENFSFLAKPFSLKQLVETVKNTLSE
jgi:two-component system cell cycle sensor histidine kinase/response regulator CckA